MQYDNSWTKAQIARREAINEIIKDYNEEIDWWFENEASINNFKIRKDPSGAFITAQQKRDFAAWYPVSPSLPHLYILIARLPF